MRPKSISNKLFRQSVCALQDELELEDKNFWLCNRTGYSYRELWDIACTAYRWDRFMLALGYEPLSNKSRFWKWDGGIWAKIVVPWCRVFVPQWERAFREYVADETQNKLAIMEPEAQQKVLTAAAKALNIDESVLTHFVSHREEIELFLEAARSTLGTLAESKLWELVMQGDAATIRWLLPRIKTDIFGDKLAQVAPTDSGSRTIRIIDMPDEL